MAMTRCGMWKVSLHPRSPSLKEPQKGEPMRHANVANIMWCWDIASLHQMGKIIVVFLGDSSASPSTMGGKTSFIRSHKCDFLCLFSGNHEFKQFYCAYINEAHSCSVYMTAQFYPGSQKRSVCSLPFSSHIALCWNHFFFHFHLAFCNPVYSLKTF